MTADLGLRRKVYEAMGWRERRVNDSAGWERDGTLVSFILPTIELSNGLALDALVEFCGKHDQALAWEMTCNNGQTVYVDIADPMFEINAAAWHIRATGETPALAICRAIVAAKEKL